jgi:hypothetical protein
MSDQIKALYRRGFRILPFIEAPGEQLANCSRDSRYAIGDGG